MIITAKFASVCPTCSNRIDVGAKVEWSKGARAVHAACVAAAPAAAKPAQTRNPLTVRSSTRRARGARFCEGWGADNPHAPLPPYTCTQCGHDE